MDDEGDYFGVVIPFAAHCGVEPVLMADGRAELRLASTRRHENSIGMTHGGMLMTLLDMALASAARSTLPPDVTVMTVDVHVTFLAPARGRLSAQGRVVKEGRSIIFCDAEIVDAEGVVCARASGVFRPTPRRPGGPRGGDA